MAENLVEIRGLKVAIPGEDGPTQILSGVELSLRKGEILGVIGESGSGKTMTGMALLRLLPSRAVVESQALRFDDTELSLLDAAEFGALRGVRLAMIFQDPVGSFNPAKTVGWHFRAVFRRVGGEDGDWSERAVALMREVGIVRAAESVDCYPHQLSGGMLQRALIALVLALKPQLVIADEPTTNLDKLVERQILDLFRQMRDRLSAGMIFVTHDMAVAAGLCDRIAVMKSGEVVETGTTQQIFEAPQHPYTQLLINTAFALPRAAPAQPQAGDARAPLMSVDQLDLIFRTQGGRAPFQALKKISLDLRQGEILGLVGESGSGKTTLGKTMLRLYEPSGGTLRLRDADITHASERQLHPFRRQMQMVFQDPGGSFNPRRTIGDALAVALRTHDICAKAEIEGRIASLLERVGLQPVHARRYPHELSGGQLQRAAIARAVSISPAMIVADEAVSKLDVSIRAGVLELFRSIQAETGMSMVFITHDLEVARFLCHRVAVLYHGNLVEIGDTAKVFADPQHDYTKALLSTLEHGLAGSALAAAAALPRQELAS